MEDRILILAPRGRDAQVAQTLLRQHGLAAVISVDIADLLDNLTAGAGAVLITEEALAGGDPKPLANWVEGQPKWSDLPFVVLANGNKGPRSRAAAALLDSLGNVVLLERPLHADAMIGAIRSSLKARQRQYEVRAFAETLEQRVAERTGELLAARESLEIALDAAEMGSWDLDLKTDRARRSLRHDEIFGYSSLRPSWGRDIFLAHVVDEERASVASAFDAAAESGMLDIECSINAANGERRFIAAKGRLHYDEAGQPIRMTGVVADITARKEADARLAQVQKMDTVGQLTGGVAHDFNNLLTPIIGSLDMLRRRSQGDERTDRLIDGALQAAERAATLTQRLLAFARRQTLQPRAVDVGALVDGMVELVRRTLGPTIEISVDIPRHLTAARVDPSQLELALLNLAINARDAMPGGGRLTFSAHEMHVDERNKHGLAAGHYLRVLAVDSGTGMDAATLARAAEPFFSTKGVGKGTGLGLSMVHGLAAQSGGMLRIESQPGHGTTVELWLPATQETSAAASKAAAEIPQLRRSATVLLVDDEDVVRTATADMLGDLGFKVIPLSSGAKALAALRSGIEADILVTDYLMPGMTGAALVREMRDAGHRLPALLITGYAEAADDLPPDLPYLAKPFRQLDLAARIDSLVQPSAKQGARGSLRLVRD